MEKLKAAAYGDQNQCGSLEFFNKVSNMFTYSLNEFIPNSVKR